MKDDFPDSATVLLINSLHDDRGGHAIRGVCLLFVPAACFDEGFEFRPGRVSRREE